MPIFYVHTQTNVRVFDDEGFEFSSFIEARREAVRTCGQMIQDAPELFSSPHPWSVTVTDLDGTIIWAAFVHGHTTAAGWAVEQSVATGPVAP